MGKIIDTNLSYMDNALRAYAAVKNEESIVDDAIYLSTNIINGKSEELGTSSDICSFIKRMENLKSLSELLSSIPETLNEISIYCANNINYFLSQIILKDLEMIVLQIKKLTSTIKRTIAEWTKMILQWATAGRGGAAIMTLILPVITLYKGISILATGILTGVQIILDSLPSPIAVPAEGISFFMTPKSLQTTEANILNSSQSAVYWLPTTVMDTINETIKTVDKLNIPIKVAAISASALSIRNMIANNNDFEINCPDLSKLNPKEILKLIDVILKVLPIPQPLPKYENLSLLNLGFLAWLLTGFCPAGQSSFGLPG